ncbi:MAG: hypothetical protein LBU21_01030 [Treponema sp.]|jgi:hypothetical protein|nr:hypothetical protein [Treponema sp.]
MGLLNKAAAKVRPADILRAADREPEGGNPVAAPAEYASVCKLPGELQNEILKYCNTYTSVHGIVLAYPKNYDEEQQGESFCAQVNRIVTALGSAVPLSARHTLVLFSNTIDRELLAHRLSKSLETEVPAVFQADNVDVVVEYIRPFL